PCPYLPLSMLFPFFFQQSHGSLSQDSRADGKGGFVQVENRAVMWAALVVVLRAQAEHRTWRDLAHITEVFSAHAGFIRVQPLLTQQFTANPSNHFRDPWIVVPCWVAPNNFQLVIPP